LELHPDHGEEIPKDLPPEKRAKVKIAVHVDADRAHLVTKIFITGILFKPYITPIRRISKRQKTVETSSYGSELVASRISTEIILEARYMLWSLRVALDWPELILRDNMSVFLKDAVTSNVLKNKHNGIAYH
jgi:hypothetical protein